MKQSAKIRSEQEVFDELACLCTLPGYVHAIAALCFRDNFVSFSDDLTEEDMLPWLSNRGLIRNETATLIGLMMQAPIDFTLPAPEIFFDYIKQTESLLQELHQAIQAEAEKVIISERITALDSNPFTFGKVLREPIFYGTESAYSSQYRDLAPLKYKEDADWLLQNKNVDIAIGREICVGIAQLLNERIVETLRGFKDKRIQDRSILPGFTFSCDELAAKIGLSEQSVRSVIEAFAMPESVVNPTLISLQEFNAAYAYPFIRRGSDEFIMLQPYGFSEAFYETPFYWMRKDESYAPVALQHRGEFTEAFAADRLTKVFGHDKVFQNVEILKSRGNILGEIDVLVVFGNHAIVLQAKSKKLTLQAQKGDDSKLKSDFQKAVQDSVDQAVKCAELLENTSVSLRCRDGRTVTLSETLDTIFLVSVVADHYPALAFQSRQFLEVSHGQQISSPLVIDIFALDVITEMLDSPLRMLSYLNLRARFGEKLMANHELTVLAYHLNGNIWVDDNINLIALDDDISVGLDVAIMVRREGVDGEKTPDGILTRFKGTHFERIITEIEHNPDCAAIDLGLLLLEMGENTIWQMNGYIDQILIKTGSDGGLHDATMSLSTISCGLTLHCSMLDSRKAAERLHMHCAIRKYSQKADKWFGVAFNKDGSVHLVGKFYHPWEYDDEMEAALKIWTTQGNSQNRETP